MFLFVLEVIDQQGRFLSASGRAVVQAIVARPNEAPYELAGDTGYVTFPCGATVGPDGDTINLYYGAADTSIALATGSIRQILAEVPKMADVVAA